MAEKRARIKIDDLPKNAKIDEEDLKRVRGGMYMVFPKVEINLRRSNTLLSGIRFDSYFKF